MARSRRKEMSKVNSGVGLENHPLYSEMQSVRSKMTNSCFNDFLHALHQLAEKVNQDDVYAVHKNSDICRLISQLFVDAKDRYAGKERKDEIRMKQALFMERLGDCTVALSILDSLAKKASSSIRWSAMNSRSCLLKKMDRFDEALVSVNELVAVFNDASVTEKPGTRRMRDACKLKEEIMHLIAATKGEVELKELGVEGKHSRVTSTHVGFFAKAAANKVDSVVEHYEGGRISPLVQQLFQ